jgi:hypothetical protein
MAVPLLYSTDHIDYLQRTGSEPPALLAEAAATRAIPNLRPLFRIREIGVFEKPNRDPNHRGSQDRLRLPTEDLIVSLCSYEICIAFLLNGTMNGVKLAVGTWVPSTSGDAADVSTQNQSILESSVRALYPSIQYESADVLSPHKLGGIALGIPTIKPLDQTEGLFPIDRLIRAMFREEWACLVLAQPVREPRIRKLRDSVIDEMRTVQSAVRSEQVSSPLAEHYVELLKASLKALSSSLAVGCWRTGAFLLGNKESYPKLASVWRGIFSGDDSLPEPIRVWENAYVPKMASDWAMPDAACPPGPGRFRHLVQYQTILSSTQLSGYIHLPKFETTGFGVRLVPDFDSVPSVVSSGAAIKLGKVIPASKLFPADPPQDTSPLDWARQWYERELPDSYYEISLKALTKHVFVAGVTGAGKTRTIFRMLKNAFATNVPFLVIEPAKTEYRELLRHVEVGDRLQVFTPGNENISPFRLNPFEVPEGTPISVHIDLLRSILSACFGWWNPMPQVFEKCAQLLYADRGWDVAADYNSRAKSRDKDDPNLFPTLSELLTKADQIIPTLGYDPQAMGRVTGHFRATLLGLSGGSKGRMLDVERSIPMSVLLENPTVIELEGLGDDDDKAFMMGLLLIRLVEHRRSPREKERIAANRGLRHILVIEEAHRLLTNVSAKSQEGAANPREKAVESFANLLAEIRNYGQGVIVADQVPTKLAPDVIKNTNLKIAHRVVEAIDRQVLAGSMAMTDKQTLTIATLRPGQAAIFAEGDDAPLLVHIAPGNEQNVPDQQAVHALMMKSKVFTANPDILARHPGCTDVGENAGQACEAARLTIDAPTFRRDMNRFVLSVLADKSAAERLWAPIESSIDSLLPRGVDRHVMLRCMISRAARDFASKRGFQYQWSFQDTAQLAECLQSLMESLAARANSISAVEKLQGVVDRLCARDVTPYPQCGMICNSEPPRCLYRYAVADVIKAGTFGQLWNASDPTNPARAREQWNLSLYVANTLVENSSAQTVPFRRIGLCFQQMMLSLYAPGVIPESKAESIKAISVCSGHASGATK